MDKYTEIKTLVIYKHHYRETYDIPLQAQFLCMGYYDGLTLFDENIKDTSSLILKSTHSPISTIWYGMQKVASQINGRFSTQIVGLFRVPKDEKEEANKADKYTNYPYVSLLFLQLDREQDEVQTSHTLEQNYTRSDAEYKIRVSAYLTFDNASVVCICCANSINKLSETVKKIEKEPFVLYSHSIYGINHDYLHQCAESAEFQDVYNDFNVHADEIIYNLSMRMSHSESDTFEEKIMTLLNACNKMTKFEINGIENARFFHKQEHINSVIVLPKSNVKTLISLFVDNGIGTHPNKLYEKELYSIETSFSSSDGNTPMRQKENDDYGWLNQVPLQATEKENSNAWTEKEISKYIAYANGELEAGNEAAYASYVGVIRTLNAVSQYENYKMGKELFYILYPSFSLFNKLIDEARKGWKESDNSQAQEAIKTHINSYISSVNAVLYHTIHSDQLYFMLPGYSGVSYSIPLKLLMFYNWYCQSLINILNDGNSHIYRVLISPVMEDVAKATYLDFHTRSRDRVLFVKISQRAMSFPRNNMIVLCHEIGHYVGDRMRQRKRRLICLCKALATLIAECIWAKREEEDYYDENLQKIYVEMLLKLREATVIIYSNRLAKKLVESNSKTVYYFREIYDEIFTLVKRLILEEKGQVWKDAVPDILAFTEGLNDKEKEVFLLRYRKLVEDEKANRTDVISSGKIDEMISFIMTMFREVYADVTALSVLGCDFSDFKQSFAVSEGQVFRDDLQDKQIQLRLRIAEIIYDIRNNTDVQNEGKESELRLETAEISNSYCEFSWLKQILAEYGKACRTELEAEFSQHTSLIKDIRDAYHMFDGSCDYSAEDIYQNVRNKNNLYQEQVRKMLDEDNENTL